MRILYVTTIASTLNFFPEHIRMLQNEGHTVELACNLSKPLPSSVEQLGSKAHHIPFSRSPFSKDNIAACREFKALITAERYDIIHTHTPNASAVVRLVCRKTRKNGTKVFYTAHGFHFYKGAPLKNWLLYYPVEWVLSWLTDVLITINHEDHKRASKQFHAKKTVYIPGVGVDTAQFGCYQTRESKRQELGIPQNATVLLTVGELNENKNQAVVLKAMAELKNPDLHYVLCGQGEQAGSLHQLAADLGIADRVHLLGFRHDVPEIYPAADIYLCPSFREGLNVSIMEAMASSLPVICSDIRGNRDLVEEEAGGMRCKPDDVRSFMAAIYRLLDNSPLCRTMRMYNRATVEQFSFQNVLNELKKLEG